MKHIWTSIIEYYHPSNSYIYLYGDMDVVERLEWLDKEYLSLYDYKKLIQKLINSPHLMK